MTIHSIRISDGVCYGSIPAKVNKTQNDQKSQERFLPGVSFVNVYVRESKTSRLITPTMFICSCICNTSLLKECIYNFKCTQTWQEYTGAVLGGGAFGGYSPPPSPPPLSEIFRICGRVIIQAPSSPPPQTKSLEPRLGIHQNTQNIIYTVAI